MDEKTILTEQEYEREVYDFIIKNGFRKMPMETFLFGYKLYCQGKGFYQDLSILLLEFIKDADVKMMYPDDAFQVINIQESLAYQEQHSNQR